MLRKIWVVIFETSLKYSLKHAAANFFPFGATMSATKHPQMFKTQNKESIFDEH